MEKKRCNDVSQANRVWKPGGLLLLQAPGSLLGLCSQEYHMQIALVVEHGLEVHKVYSIHGSVDDTIYLAFDPGGINCLKECGGLLVKHTHWKGQEKCESFDGVLRIHSNFWVVTENLETKTLSGVKKLVEKDDNKSFYTIWSDCKACLLLELTYCESIGCKTYDKELLATCEKLLDWVCFHSFERKAITEIVTTWKKLNTNNVGELKLAVYYVLKLRLLIHLEDKVDFQRGSSSRWKMVDYNTEKTQARKDETGQKWRFILCYGIGTRTWKNRLELTSWEAEKKK